MDNLSPECQFVLHLARVDVDDENHVEARQLLAKPLDWNWIVVTATRHKVLQLLWDNMKRLDLVAPALGTGGLPELWTVYIAQMFAAGRERNRLWMVNVEEIAAQLQKVGIQLVAIKGAALIGDIYTVENRFLNDIDFIARRADLGAIRDRMFDLGYEYGSYNYATGVIDPIAERVERAWLFHNHVMPNLYRLSDSPVVPYYKIQVGYGFFDPFEDFQVDGSVVVDDAVVKSPGSAILIPSLVDTLINLCCHIYREGVSMVYQDYNVNWQLGKLCDLLSFLRKHDAELDPVQFMDKVDSLGIRRPVFYGFYYTSEAYRHPVLERWLAASDPGDRTYLNELRDGDRRAYTDEPFVERLFSLRAVSPAFQGGWNKQFRRDQW